MTEGITAAIAAAFTAGGIIVTAFLSQAGLKRRYSGDIRTIEAKTLWAESHSLRETVLAMNVRLEERVHELELTVSDLRAQLEEAQQLHSALLRRIAQLESEGIRKDSEITNLKHARGLLEERVAELEEELRKRMEIARASAEHTSTIRRSTDGTPTPQS